MSMIDPGLGTLLRDARMANGWTLIELGERSGVSYSRISRIENGASASDELLKPLAEALGLEFIPAVPSQVRKRA